VQQNLPWRLVMEVILLKHVEGLGRRGQVVKVRSGYARNFLLPRRMALRATMGAKRLVEQEARKFEELDLKARSSAAEVAERLAALTLTIPAKADEDHKLYGSVGTTEIHHALVQEGLALERKQVVLDHPIKLLGEYDVAIKLHLDVRGTVKVNVVQE
jgi:large subunit ribosomal protein L9